MEASTGMKVLSTLNWFSLFEMACTPACSICLRLAWRMNVFLDGAGVAAALLAGFFVVVVGSA